MTDFIWRDELISSLQQLAPLLLIETEDDARAAAAALRYYPAGQNQQQAVVLGRLRQLIEQAVDDWNSQVQLPATEVDNPPAETAVEAVPASKAVTETDHALGFLLVLMQEQQLKAVDLCPLIGSKPLLSLILSGKRSLTRNHITRLSQHFRVNPALFFPPFPLTRFVAKPTTTQAFKNFTETGLWMELRMYMETRLREGKNKQRNMDLVCDYFGFSTAAWVDLQSLADKYGFSSREASRLILQRCFRDFGNTSDLPLARQAGNLLEYAGAVSMPEFTQILLDQGLLDQPVQAHGLMLYLRELGLCQNFKVYAQDMLPLRKSIATNDLPMWLIDAQWLDKHKDMLKALYVLPGQIGLACVDDYISRHKLDETEQKLIWLMLENTSDVWQQQYAGKNWFTIESRNNRFLNDLGKIFSVITHCTPTQLAHSLLNGLASRGQKQAFAQVELIESYLKESIHTEFDGSYIRFNGPLLALTAVEKDAVDWLKQREYASYPDLKNHLLELGYSKPNLDKTVTTSSLVTVDKSRGRTQYRYSWIGALPEGSDSSATNKVLDH